MYVCKYDGRTPLFSELCNLKWQYSGCSMVCINKCFAPWKSKKRKTNTHAVSALLDPALLFGLYRILLHLYREPMNAALCVCVRAHTVCPEYHCWVLIRVCVCAVGVGGLSGASPALGRLASAPCTGLDYEHKGEFRDKRHRWRAPFLWLLLYTFLSSECVNLYTWCENSSINVYQENGTKTKNVTF